jgi:tetratricopeptide (TPR) repeat protein
MPMGSILLGLALLAAETPAARRVEALAHVREGQQMLAAERYERAAEAFGSAIALDDRLLIAHYGLGQASMAMKEYKEAIRAFETARTIFEDEKADAPTKRIAARHEREEQAKVLRERARANASRGTAAGRQNAETQAELTVNQAERMIETLEYMSKADLDHTPPALSLALGSAYFRDRRPLDAEREYRAALAADDRMAEAHNNLAVVLLLTGRAREARESLKLARKHGFRVPPGLEQDVEMAAAR